MTSHSAKSAAARAAILLASVGLTAPAAVAAGETTAAPAPSSAPAARAGSLVPLHKAGVMYINMSTGERSLTLYGDSGKATDAWLAQPDEVGVRTGAPLFDYWMSMDLNPCIEHPLEIGFGWNADATGDVTGGITEPIVGWDYGEMPFDSKITGVLIHTAVLATEGTDSNGDGTLDTGIDTVGVYYDALSEVQRSSNTPPTAAVRIESIPGDRGSSPNGFAEYDLVLDFGGDWFELGDSDGQDLGALWLPGANSGEDVVATRTVNGSIVEQDFADGLADIQYLQYYAQHGTDSKVTADSTFIGLGSPEGDVSFITTTSSLCTCVSSTSCTCQQTIITIFTPDPLPQGQGVKEGFGIGALGPGGDTTNIDGSIAGCCFWFGGLDCAGFLDQFVEEPFNNATYYNFTPFAQNAHGFFSDAPVFDPCQSIDFNGDGILDNGDIGLFIAAKLGQDLSIADVNGDGVCDNGDIGAFVSLFLSCTG
ncbi:MAG: hypothetical protein ACI89L_002700 [Phycisphaerales bacterium]|jgi:hypothetical protein